MSTDAVAQPVGDGAARPRLAREVREGDGPEVLAEIVAPGVAAAIWTRKRDPLFAAWLDALGPERLPQLRLTLDAARAEEAAAAACDLADLPDGPGRRMLVGDVGALAQRAATLFGTDRLALRLQPVAGTSCPRFHLDAVRARLICTLRGSGTEWAPARLDAEPGPVTRVPTGAVALFRGRLWGQGEMPAILHRSPPAAEGAERLVLVIDPAEEDPWD